MQGERKSMMGRDIRSVPVEVSEGRVKRKNNVDTCCDICILIFAFTCDIIIIFFPVSAVYGHVCTLRQNCVFL